MAYCGELVMKMISTSGSARRISSAADIPSMKVISMSIKIRS